MSNHERDELIRYRYEKAKETINIDVVIQIENRLWNIAVNRMYYRMYYSVSALLASIDIYPKSHSGVGQMFNLHFIKTGKLGKKYSELYKQLFEMRQDSDYEDFIDYEEKDVIGLVAPVKEFVAVIGTMLSL